MAFSIRRNSGTSYKWYQPRFDGIPNTMQWMCEFPRIVLELQLISLSDKDRDKDPGKDKDKVKVVEATVVVAT